MNKKYFLIISLIVGIIAIVPLSAADENVNILSALNITSFNEDTTVNIGGIDFNIPKGYGEEKDITKNNYSMSLGIEKVVLNNYYYLNNAGDMLNVQVIFNKDKNLTMDSLTPEDGDTKKTINGKEGFYSESDNVATFMYVQDGKSVQITGNKDIISKVIK